MLTEQIEIQIKRFKNQNGQPITWKIFKVVLKLANNIINKRALLFLSC